MCVSVQYSTFSSAACAVPNASTTVPDTDDDGEVPDEAAVLVAVALRLSNDEEFYREMLDWLRKDVEDKKPAQKFNIPETFRKVTSILRISFGDLVGFVLLARFEQEVTRAEVYEPHDQHRGEDDKERQTKVPRHGRPDNNRQGECANIQPNDTTKTRPEGDRGQKPSGIEAAMRADALLDAGDLDGQRVWLRVIEAIKTLSSTSPSLGSTLH